MHDILHQMHIAAPPDAVYAAVSSPRGLDSWWTMESSGRAATGEEWVLYFGPEWDWRATVLHAVPDRGIAWEITRADADWTGTRVAIDIAPSGSGTTVAFRHGGWPEAGDHFRVSSYCWALYLRLLKRYVERGETVPYGERYEA